MKVFGVVEVNANKEIDVYVQGNERYDDEVEQAAFFFTKEEARSALDWWAGQIHPDEGNSYAIAEFELPEGKIVFVNVVEEEEEV